METGEFLELVGQLPWVCSSRQTLSGKVGDEKPVKLTSDLHMCA